MTTYVLLDMDVSEGLRDLFAKDPWFACREILKHYELIGLEAEYFITCYQYKRRIVLLEEEAYEDRIAVYIDADDENETILHLVSKWSLKLHKVLDDHE